MTDIVMTTQYLSFTTGPDPAVLNSVTVHVGLIHSLAFPTTPSLAASIRADIGAGRLSNPDLETLPTYHPPTDIVGDVTFPSAGLPLDAHTTYWLRLIPNNYGVGHWRCTTLTAETSAYGWTIGDGDGRYIGVLTVDATILPEPTLTCALCTLATLRPGRCRRR